MVKLNHIQSVLPHHEYDSARRTLRDRDTTSLFDRPITETDKRLHHKTRQQRSRVGIAHDLTHMEYGFWIILAITDNLIVLTNVSASI